MGGEHVSVGSSVVNLAGDQSKRPDFLKSLIMGGIMQGADSLGELIGAGYRDGPGIKLRRYAKWARQDDEFLNIMGTTKGELGQVRSLDLAGILPHLPLEPDQASAQILEAEVGEPDLTYWVMQYLAIHDPEKLESEFTYEFDSELMEITVSFTGTEDTLVIPATGYIEGARYLYVRYLPLGGEKYGEWELGDLIDLPPGSNFPPMDGWEQVVLNTPEIVEQLRWTSRVEVTYSDGRPGQISSSTGVKEGRAHEVQAVYRQDEYKGVDPENPGSYYSIRTSQEHIRSFEIKERVTTDTKIEILVDGTVKTTRTTNTTEYLSPLHQTRENTQKIIHETFFPLRIFIYREGSGNADLDALMAEPESEDTGFFFPPIPFRYKNEPLTDKYVVWDITLPEELFEWTFDPPLIAGDVFYLTTDPEVVLGNTPQLNEDGDPNYFVGVIQSMSQSTRRARVRHNSKSNSQWSVAQKKWLYHLFEKSKPIYVARRFISELGKIIYSPWYPIGDYDPLGISSGQNFDDFKLMKKAFKKATDANYAEVMEQINNNEDIGDIDYAYAVFGVALNVQENACKKYVYKFFKRLMQSYAVPTPGEESLFWEQFNEALEAEKEWVAWHNAQSNAPAKTYYDAPQKKPYPDIPWFNLKVHSVRQNVSNYRTEMRWSFISEDTGQGLLKPDAKPGDLWFEVLPDPIDYHASGFGMYRVHDFWNNNGFNQKIALNWQVSSTEWTRLVITGLHHKNVIYKSHHVFTTAKEALQHEADDGGYEESGFIVPLHESIFNEMGLVDQTQMATACCFLVFNYYVAKKKKWYESDWFKVILIVVVIVVAVAITVFSGGAAALGLLGTAGEVGAAIGLTGTAAVIAGAAINALAGLVVGLLLTEAATAIFGDEIGSIVGSILTLVLTVGISAGSFMQAWDVLTSAAGLAQLGLAAGNGVSTYLQHATAGVYEELEEMAEKWGSQVAEMQRRYNEEFGDGQPIDPEMFRELIDELRERPERFLKRTLMLGSDIVEMTLDAVYDFTDYTLKLEYPI